MQLMPFKLMLFTGFYLFFSCMVIEDPQSPDPTQSKPIEYLALGDSYTIGTSVEAEEAYPFLLQQKMREKGITWGNTKIVAKAGWRTDQLKAGIASSQFLEQYDLVSLLIGVNNQYQGFSLEDYKKEFSELLEMAIQFAGSSEKVIVFSIPDYAYTPFGQQGDTARISKEIDDYNRANRKISEQYAVTYLDITEISRVGLAQPDLVASDGLHPSGKMYAEWIAKYQEVILDKISG